jgi:hypothetical protein
MAFLNVEDLVSSGGNKWNGSPSMKIQEMLG